MKSISEQYAEYRRAVEAYELRLDAQYLAFLAGLQIAVGFRPRGVIDDIAQIMIEAEGLDSGAEDG